MNQLRRQDRERRRGGQKHLLALVDRTTVLATCSLALSVPLLSFPLFRVSLGAKNSSRYAHIHSFLQQLKRELAELVPCDILLTSHSPRLESAVRSFAHINHLCTLLYLDPVSAATFPRPSPSHVSPRVRECVACGMGCLIHRKRRSSHPNQGTRID